MKLTILENYGTDVKLLLDDNPINAKVNQIEIKECLPTKKNKFQTRSVMGGKTPIEVELGLLVDRKSFTSIEELLGLDDCDILGSSIQEVHMKEKRGKIDLQIRLLIEEVVENKENFINEKQDAIDNRLGDDKYAF